MFARERNIYSLPKARERSKNESHSEIDSPPDRYARRSSSWLAYVEWVFLLVGLAALDTYVWVNASTVLSQAYQDWAFDQTLRGQVPSVRGFVGDEFSWLFGSQREKVEAPEAAPKLEPMPQGKPPLPSSVIGRIEIPRLNLSVMVREGADGKTLHRAVGHIPGTALPGYAGNVALAGHRDTFFRALRNIQKDDAIQLETENGNLSLLSKVHRYRRTERSRRPSCLTRADFDAGDVLSVLLRRVSAQTLYCARDAGVAYPAAPTAARLCLSFAESVVRLRPSISAASFLLPRVFFSACSRIFNSILPTVRSKSRP